MGQWAPSGGGWAQCRLSGPISDLDCPDHLLQGSAARHWVALCGHSLCSLSASLASLSWAEHLCMGSCDNACRLQAHRYRLRADSVEDRSFLPTPLPLLLSTILSSCCLSALSPSLSACVATLSPTSFHVRPGSSLLTTGLSLSVSVCLSLSLTFSFSLSHPPLLYLCLPSSSLPLLPSLGSGEDTVNFSFLWLQQADMGGSPGSLSGPSLWTGPPPPHHLPEQPPLRCVMSNQNPWARPAEDRGTGSFPGGEGGAASQGTAGSEAQLLIQPWPLWILCLPRGEDPCWNFTPAPRDPPRMKAIAASRAGIVRVAISYVCMSGRTHTWI